MNCKGPYRVYAGQTVRETEDEGMFVGEYDTLAEAKQRARRALTEEYRQLIEMSERHRYSQVVNLKGECLADYFATDYKEEEVCPHCGERESKCGCDPICPKTHQTW